MRARVLSIESPDVELNPYRADDLLDDGFPLTLYVGPQDGPGEESFSLFVCTPPWLARRVEEIGRPLVGRHYLTVESMNPREVTEFLTREVELLDAPTWSELAAKVGRLGR